MSQKRRTHADDIDGRKQIRQGAASFAPARPPPVKDDPPLIARPAVHYDEEDGEDGVKGKPVGASKPAPVLTSASPSLPLPPLLARLPADLPVVSSTLSRSHATAGSAAATAVTSSSSSSSTSTALVSLSSAALMAPVAAGRGDEVVVWANPSQMAHAALVPRDISTTLCPYFDTCDPSLLGLTSNQKERKEAKGKGKRPNNKKKKNKRATGRLAIYMNYGDRNASFRTPLMPVKSAMMGYGNYYESGNEPSFPTKELHLAKCEVIASIDRKAMDVKFAPLGPELDKFSVWLQELDQQFFRTIVKEDLIPEWIASIKTECKKAQLEPYVTNYNTVKIQLEALQGAGQKTSKEVEDGIKAAQLAIDTAERDIDKKQEFKDPVDLPTLTKVTDLFYTRHGKPATIISRTTGERMFKAVWNVTRFLTDAEVLANRGRDPIVWSLSDKLAKLCIGLRKELMNRTNTPLDVWPVPNEIPFHTLAEHGGDTVQIPWDKMKLGQGAQVSFAINPRVSYNPPKDRDPGSVRIEHQAVRIDIYHFGDPTASDGPRREAVSVHKPVPGAQPVPKWLLEQISGPVYTGGGFRIDEVPDGDKTVTRFGGAGGGGVGSSGDKWVN